MDTFTKKLADYLPPGMTIHPVCALFPMMTPDKLQELADDIKLTGLAMPVVRHGNVLLDGRNRLLACKMAGVDPKWQDFTGDDPSRWILSTNLKRRHLTPEQSVSIAAEASEAILRDAMERKAATAFKPGIAPNPTGANQHTRKVNPDSGSPSSKRDAKQMHDRSSAGTLAATAGVSRHKAEQALAIKRAAKKGEIKPEVYQSVLNGTMSHKEALATRCLPAPSQEYLAEMAELERKEAEAIAAAAHLPPLIVVADAPLDTQPVRALAHDAPKTDANAVLFIWAHQDTLAKAMELIEAWGFRYASYIAWDTARISDGQWVKRQVDLLLIASKGNAAPPDEHHRIPSMWREARSNSSDSHDAIYKAIGQMLPEAKGRMLEMYAHGPRQGWRTESNAA